MKRSRFILAFALMFALAAPAWAGMSESVTMIGEGAVGLPVSLLKLVGGTLKLVGEVLIFPFQALGA